MPLVLGIRYPLAGLRGLRKPAIGVLDETRIRMRVRPSDCDVLMHMNNGRYLSIMDIGRIDQVARAGWLRMFRKQDWNAVAGGVTIRFRRELRLGARYELVTRCVGWEDTWWYFEQRFEREDGSLAARAYAKVTILDAHKKRVPAERVLEALGSDLASPDLPEGIAAWQSSEFG